MNYRVTWSGRGKRYGQYDCYKDNLWLDEAVKFVKRLFILGYRDATICYIPKSETPFGASRVGGATLLTRKPRPKEEK